jgi:hypothetical protein
MSNAAQPKADPALLKTKVVELATMIFARLAGDATKVSFKLAAVFQKVEDEINADALPKTGFNLAGADISSWTK